MAKSTTNSNKNRPANENIGIAKVGMWQAIIVALITTLGGILAGYVTGYSRQESDPSKEKPVVVVPISNTNTVKTLPEESNKDHYQLIKDISIFDLRGWKVTPDSLKNRRYSPTNYTNYLHIRKTKPLKQIVIHYATSGSAIDMRCITNRFDFYQKEKPNFHDGKTTKEYALVIDVSGMEIDKEYLIVVEATYWNGFNNLKEEDASTYTDEEIHGLNELGLIVFFPDNKPFSNVSRLDRDENEKEDEYRGDENFYPDKNKKFVYWSIQERLPNHHYKLKWNW